MISTGPIIRTMRLDSASTTSTTRGSLSHRAAHSTANADGSTSASSTAVPSAFDTIFDVTTTTSSSASSDGTADQRGEVVAGFDLGQAVDADDLDGHGGQADEEARRSPR